MTRWTILMTWKLGLANTTLGFVASLNPFPIQKLSLKNSFNTSSLIYLLTSWNWIECTGPWRHPVMMACQETLSQRLIIMWSKSKRNSWPAAVGPQNPATIQKRRALKPLLQPLIAKNIKYYWAFPFQLNFTFRNKNHSLSMFPESNVLLKKLGLIFVDPEGSPHTPQPISPANRPHKVPDLQCGVPTRSQAKLKGRPPEDKGGSWVQMDLVKSFFFFHWS